MDITVCIGSSCHLKGSPVVVERLQRLVSEHKLAEMILLRGCFCMNRCQSGVSVLLDGAEYSLTPENVDHFFMEIVLPRCAKQTRADDVPQLHDRIHK